MHTLLKIKWYSQMHRILMTNNSTPSCMVANLWLLTRSICLDSLIGKPILMAAHVQSVEDGILQCGCNEIIKFEV